MAGFYNQHFFSAIELIHKYTYKETFPSYLKNYFRRHKKFGSRDRKNIADLCYGYMRLGKSALAYPVEQQITIGYYFTHQFDNGLLETHAPFLLNSIGDDLQQKLKFVTRAFPAFDASLIFSFTPYVSPEIDLKLFTTSHLQKPLFFIKIRKKEKQETINKLVEMKIPFRSFNEDILGFEQHIDLAEFFKLDEDIVIQDISSQHTMNLLHDHPIRGEAVWDACAGSGGKSILAHDRFRFSAHYASDIRPAILNELEKRMYRAKISLTDAFCVDLSNNLSIQVAQSHLPTTGVELIIADVPCSGSGTWGRSPEWLRSFDEDQIAVYQRKQVHIVKNLLPFIQSGGFLLYITCSVFSEENEAVLTCIQQSHDIKILEQKYCIGFPHGGDQLFASLITL